MTGDLEQMRAANIAAGLTCVERGLAAFPIAIIWDDAKGKTNKRPLTDHGFTDAVQDKDELLGLIRSGVGRMRPGEVLACAVRPGSGGFVVFDGDVDNGKHGAEFLHDVLKLPPWTYSPRTASGGVHQWYRKRSDVVVGNVATWEKQGVDVRSDKGYLVSPGTITPWGSWTDPAEPGWGTFAQVPEKIWTEMVGATGSGSSSSPTGSATWKRYDPTTHDEVLHPATLDILEWLTSDERGENKVKVESITFRTRADGDPYLELTRPGKGSGISATLGYVSPGALKVFSSNWPEVGSGVYDIWQLRSPAPPANGDKPSDQGGDTQPSKRARLTPASEIVGKVVQWLWAARLPVGSLAVTAGREATGKTSFGIWVAAQLSRGLLEGARSGKPSNVFILSVEDSWEYTLRPRLQAAGADLDRIFRFDVITEVGNEVTLSLPADMRLLEDKILEYDAALVFIDPLLSFVSTKLDSHKNHEVRQALDPLAGLADRTGTSVVGNAHFNKSASTDVSSLIVGSGAFKDVPRAIFGFACDMETGERVMTQTKNSLGRLDDLPSLEYRLESTAVEVADGITDVGRLVWMGEAERSASQVLRENHRGPGEDDDAQDVLASFLKRWLTDQGGIAPAKAGHKAITDTFGEVASSKIKRARDKAGIESEKAEGFQSGWLWTLSIDSAKDAIDPIPAGVEPLKPLMESMDADSGTSGRPDPCSRCHSVFGMTPGEALCSNCQTDDYRKKTHLHIEEDEDSA